MCLGACLSPALCLPQVVLFIPVFPPLQALKDSTVVEIVEEKVRRREQPEKWPLPGPPIVDYSQTDFSQLLNCPEFVPRQHYQKETGRCPSGG